MPPPPAPPNFCCKYLRAIAKAGERQNELCSYAYICVKTTLERVLDADVDNKSRNQAVFSSLAEPGQRDRRRRCSARL